MPINLMMKYHIVVNLILLMSILFTTGHAFSSTNCRTEIRVNDARATITIDGSNIKASHYFVDCKDGPQAIKIIAPDKKPFVRMMPGVSSFTENDSYWNIRLQSYSEYLPANEVRDLSTVMTEVGQLKEAVDAALENPQKANSQFTILPQNVAAAAAPKTSITIFAGIAEDTRSPAMENEIPSSPKNMELFVLETLPGVYVQIEALPGLKSQNSEIESVNSLSEKLHGKQVTICPTNNDGAKWTKILVGPVANKGEAETLSKKYGRGSFPIRNPLCARDSKKSFQVNR